MPTKEKMSRGLETVYLIGDLFKNGRALTDYHIKAIGALKGLNPKSYINFRAERITWETGTEIGFSDYRGVKIYYEASRDLELETDIKVVRQQIDYKFKTNGVNGAKA